MKQIRTASYIETGSDLFYPGNADRNEVTGFSPEGRREKLCRRCAAE